MTFRHFYPLLAICFFFFQNFPNSIFCQNQALQFDGTTAEAKSAAAVQAVNFNRFTIETWVKMADLPSDPTDAIAGVGSLNQPLIWIWFDRTGVQFAPNSLVVGFFNGSAAVNFSHVFDFQPDVWTHVAASFNGNASPKTLDLYLDGVLAASFAPTSNPANWSDERIFLGKIPDTALPGNHLAGALDDLRIWRINRTAAQIAADKNKELIGTETNLWNYYKFNAGDCSERDCAGEDLFLKKTGNASSTAGPALTLNSTCPPAGCAAPMSGVYTVGGASPDFASIQLAINALAVRGAADSVFFHLRPGVFSGGVLTKSFFGFSENTPVIFKKEPGTTGEVQFTLGGFQIKKSNNHHFENLKFLGEVSMDTCQRTRFSDCIFSFTPSIGIALQIGLAVDSVEIKNCRFSGGQWAITIDNLGEPHKKLSIVGSDFLNQHSSAIWSNSDLEDVLIDKNYFSSSNYVEMLMLFLENTKRKIKITNNHFELAGGTAISLSNCNINQNTRALVANNYVHVGENGEYGIAAEGCSKFDFYHNTVRVEAGQSAMLLYTGALPDNRVRNNIFDLASGWYIYDTQDFDLETSNQNNFYSKNGVDIVYGASDFQEWQDLYGFDLDSETLDPEFNFDSIPSLTNPFLNNLGATIAGIPEILTDILGNTRSATTPDIGTREFTPPPANPMCGAYKIGGAGADFATPAAAVAALNFNGMDCPVFFDLRADTFPVKDLWLLDVPKTDAALPITFRRDPAAISGEAMLQKIFPSNFLIKIEGTPNVHFENLNFKNPDAASLDFRSAGGQVKKCKFFGASNPTYQIGVAANELADSLRIDSCQFIEGLHGISLVSGTGNFLTSVKIENCIFTNLTNWSVKTDGVLPDLVFQKNEFIGRGLAMNLAGASNTKILNNRFATPNGSAIFLQNLAPAAGQSALVGNNFFTIKPTAAVPGLHFSNCQKVDFLHNSVATQSGSTGTAVVFSGSQNRLKNNVFSSLHARPVLSAAAGVFSESNFNDLHTTGATLAIFGSTNCPNLAAWQTASGWDLNSVSKNPEFFSQQNLSPDAAELNAAGGSIAGFSDLATDLNGAARTAPPDLGAVQFVPGAVLPLCGSYSVGSPAADFLTMGDAAFALQSQGMDCPVVLNLQSGNYPEELSLINISKTNPNDALLIRRAVGQTAAATFSTIFRLEQVSAVEFNGLTFNLLELKNAPRSTVKKCTFLNPNLGNATSLKSLGDCDSLRVDSCQFLLSNATRISITGGTAAARPEQVLIENCSFIGEGQQILVQDSFNFLTVQKNTFSNGGFGFRINSATGTARIVGNRFYSGAKISLTNAKPSGNGRILIANNFFANCQNELSNSQRVDVFHNSFGNQFLLCLNVSGGSQQRLMNNIFQTAGSGVAALQISAMTVVDSLNHNCYHASSGFLGKLGSTNYTTLATWRTATGKESKGVDANPYFISATNLTPQNFQINQKGFALAGIPELETDIAGATRGTPPDPGAIEFVPLPPLCGEFTVGGASPYFSNFGAAIVALQARGIDCDVVLTLRSGTYSGSFSLENFPKASPSNRLTIRSESDATNGGVTISGGFKIQNLSRVSLQNLTFNLSPILVEATNANHLRVERCEFYNDDSPNFGLSIEGSCDSLRVDSCSFYSPFDTYVLGIVLNPSTASRQGILIRKNLTFNQFHFTGNLVNARIEDNFVRSTTTFSNTSGKISFVRNRFLPNQVNYFPKIKILNHAGSATERLLVANNFLNAETASDEPLLEVVTSNFVDIFQNTCRSKSTNSTAVFNSGSNLCSKNNIFANVGSGRALRVLGMSGLSESNQNNFFALHPTPFSFGNLQLSNLAAWQTATGLDGNSLAANPNLPTTPNLLDPTPRMSVLNAAGEVLTSIDPNLGFDLDSLAHSSPPDIGAKSFTPQFGSPLCGTLTIGGAAPNFTNFTAALDSMRLRGVGCDVVFHVRAGTYFENLLFDFIPKTDESWKITFRPDPANTDTVIVSGGGLTLDVQQTSRVRFERIGFQAQAASTSNHVARLTNARSCLFSKCTFVPKAATAFSLLINAVSDSTLVKDCRFSTGNPALEIANNVSNVRVENNIFQDASIAIRVNGSASGLVIERNQILSSLNTANQTGILVPNHTSGSIKILKNKIEMLGGTGIHYWGYDSQLSGSQTLLIANNFVSLGEKSAVGIYFSGEYVSGKIFHNAVRINENTGSTTETPLSVGYHYDTQIRNNIFANFGSGHAAVFTTSPLGTLNHNNYFGQGSILIKRGNTNYPTLVAWRTATNQDLQSKNVNPNFQNATSPVPTNTQLDGAGSTISGTPEISTDLFGVPRVAPTDIGAVEFGAGGFTDLGVTKILTPQNACANGSSQAVQIRVKNFGTTPEANFQVAYRIGTGAAVVQTFTAAAIAAGDSALFTFSPNVSLPTAGNYQFKAWTIRAGDATPANDSTAKTVQIFALPSLAATASTPTTCTSLNSGTLTFSASGGMAPYTFSLGGAGQASGFFQNLAAGNFTCTATDAKGCSATAVGTVSVAPDVIPPTIANCPLNLEEPIGCNQLTERIWWTPPTATDNCGGSPVWVSNFMPGDTFPIGTTAVFYTASDAAGNVAICSFSITLNEDVQTCTWLGGTGDWTNPAKWSCGVVPNYCDSVVVNSGTITTAGEVYVASLTMTGGKIVGSGLDSAFLEIHEVFNWSGGTLETPVKLSTGSQGFFQGGNLNLRKSMQNWGKVQFSSGTLAFGGSVRLENYGDLIVSGTTSSFANQLTGNLFYNWGYLNFQNFGSASFAMTVPFENESIVQLAPNFELKINRNFLGWTYSEIQFRVGSKITFLGGTAEFQELATFVASAGAFPHLVVNGGAAVLLTDGQFFIQNSKIEVLKGRWTANNPKPITNLRLAGGTIDGNGILKTQFFDWSGGSLKTNLTMLAQGGKFAGGTGILTKTLTHDGSKFDFLSGNISMGSGSKFVNNSLFRHHAPAGAFLISTNSIVSVVEPASAKPATGSNTQVFENHGVVEKDTAVAGAVARFNVPFINHSDGEFSGIGSVQFFGGLTQEGLLAPGLETAAGTLTLTRDFDNQNGVLRLTLRLLGGATSHDKLVGLRNVKLGGSLEIEEIGDLPDGSFEIISCGTLTGPTCRLDTFVGLSLPPDYSLVYENKRVLLVKDQMRPVRDREFSSLENQFFVSPNPFSEQARLDFTLKNLEEIRVVAFNAQGRELEVLLEKTWLSAGEHSISWQPRTAAQGVFFVKIFGKDFCETLRLLRI